MSPGAVPPAPDRVPGERGVAHAETAALLDIARYPLDRPGVPRWRELLERGRQLLATTGSFSLEGFVRSPTIRQAVTEVEAALAAGAYHHEAEHNIYFSDARDMPRLQRTSNLTLAGDQLGGGVLDRIYRWPGLPHFLAALFDKPALYPMADPLACVNVMGYRRGEGLGWHFDRAEFTVTLLLRAAGGGGVFEYRRNLRSATDPNRAGVVRLLHGQDPHVTTLHLTPGTLNIFAGFRSPHRVTAVTAPPARLVAVFSYMERPNFTYSDADRRRFYGRTAPHDRPH